ncbi:MAG: type II toxin-antitoxin system ParD family antitoxin [Cyclobacteriaceae bacterium]
MRKTHPSYWEIILRTLLLMKITSEKYNSASEVIRTALQLLQSGEQTKELRKALVV